MPSIKVAKNSKHDAQESFKRISHMLENDKELRKLDSKYKCHFDAAALSGRAEGSQFKAQMQIRPAEAGSHVEITVDLPFHLALVKGLVEKTLGKKLEEVLA